MVRALAQSSIEVLVLQAIRLAQSAETEAVAARYSLDPVEVAEVLADAAEFHLVAHNAFAGSEGWSLTEAGRVENERSLAEELEAVGGAEAVHEVYRNLAPLNTTLMRACSDWQLRPRPGDPFAVNDHSDAAWDEDVLAELTAISSALPSLIDLLGSVLGRFRGYDLRFADALARARAGQYEWVDRAGIDSCHRVWFELHEDILATLGLDREAEFQAYSGVANR